MKSLSLRHCVLALVGIRLLGVPAACQTTEAKTAVVRYLQAAQKHDHEALMKLSFRYQYEVQQTTRESPKILLSERLTKLHDSTLSQISADLPAILADFCIGMEDEARLTMQLLPESANWKIAEWQSRRKRANAFSPYLIVYSAYVRITYPSRDAAPTIRRSVIDDKTEALKECVLAIQVYAGIPQISLESSEWKRPISTGKTS